MSVQSYKPDLVPETWEEKLRGYEISEGRKYTIPGAEKLNDLVQAIEKLHEEGIYIDLIIKRKNMYLSRTS